MDFVEWTCSRGEAAPTTRYHIREAGYVAQLSVEATDAVYGRRRSDRCLTRWIDERHGW